MMEMNDVGNGLSELEAALLRDVESASNGNGDILERRLGSLDPDRRRLVVERLLRRLPPPSSPAPPKESVAQEPPSSIDQIKIGKARIAGLEARIREQEASCKDLEERLAEERRRRTAAEAGQDQLVQVKRTLEKERAGLIQERDDLAERLERLGAEKNRLVDQIRQREKNIADLNQRLHQLRGPAPPPTRPVDPPPASKPPEEKVLKSAEAPLEAIGMPGAPAPSILPVFWEELKRRSLVSEREPLPSFPGDQVRRAGRVLAALVEFLCNIEKLYVGTMQDYAKRHDVAKRSLQDFEGIRGDEPPPWWRVMTQPERSWSQPVQEFEEFLRTMYHGVFAMMAAYKGTLDTHVKEEAKKLAHPDEIKDRSGKKRPEEFWNYYASEACFSLPGELADRCEKVAVKLMDEFFRGAQ